MSSNANLKKFDITLLDAEDGSTSGVGFVKVRLSCEDKPLFDIRLENSDDGTVINATEHNDLYRNSYGAGHYALIAAAVSFLERAFDEYSHINDTEFFSSLFDEYAVLTFEFDVTPIRERRGVLNLSCKA